ncbi:phage tail tube protein [Bacteroides reticulotermitis]|uniref:phage tail tube protein n=1 Tax=Bacteroides reticulotermitis TaxID=1133319 RepID=UPI003A864A5F
MPEKKLDSSTDIYRGELMIFSADDPIAFAKNATVEVTTEEIDISNKMMGDWSGSLPGKKSYTASSEALLTRKVGALSYDTLLKKQIAGELLDFFFGEAVAADKDNFGGTFEKDETKANFTGKVMITSLSITSEAGQIASCSVSFKGVGALKPVEPVPAQG